MLSEIDEAELVSKGAIKTTVNLAYDGDEEYNVRFTVGVGRMAGGHAPTAVGAGTGIVRVLYKDADGVWWDIFRSGGIGNAPTYIFIDKETVKDWASIDLYVAVFDVGDFATYLEDEDEADEDEFVITLSLAFATGHGGHIHFNQRILLSSTINLEISK